MVRLENTGDNAIDDTNTKVQCLVPSPAIVMYDRSDLRSRSVFHIVKLCQSSCLEFTLGFLSARI